MKVAGINAQSQYNRHNVNFEAANVNILAQSDQHGNLSKMPSVEETIKQNKKEIFAKGDEKSTLNILALPGDFFINPLKKGFLTRPDKENGFFQAEFLKGLVKMVHNVAGKESNFEAVYTPGNHCLDGGDKYLLNKITETPVTTIMTNVDIAKSKLMRDCMDKNDGKVVTSKILKVQDDKDENKQHQILILGATIPTMDFYNPTLCPELEFFNNSNQKDANIKKEDLKETFEVLRKEVDKFKEQNDGKGAIVLMSHMGNRIAEWVHEEIPEINIILNGHDHKDYAGFFKDEVQSGMSPSIHSLGQDNEIIKGLNIHFNDEGYVDKMYVHDYACKNTENLKFLEQQYKAGKIEYKDGKAFLKPTYEELMAGKPQRELPTNKMHAMLDKYFSEDMKGRVLIIDNVEKDPLENLEYNESIRYANSFLANFLTTSIVRTLRNVYDPSIDSVAIQSSGVRGSINDRRQGGGDNLELLKVFDGVGENLSGLRVGDVTGEDLFGMIKENVLGNLKNKTRNTLLQWSDVQIDRKLIEDIEGGIEPKEKYKEAIRFRNKDRDVGVFEPIDYNKTYRIVLPKKYLEKTDIVFPQRLKPHFKDIIDPKTGSAETSNSLFAKSMKYNSHIAIIQPKIKEMRVITEHADKN